MARTKARLEEISGQQVRGFRAPSFSILPGMEWAFDILLETGHTYDSSVFPIRRPGYGWPGRPDRALRHRPARRHAPGIPDDHAGPPRLPDPGGGRRIPAAVSRSASSGAPSGTVSGRASEGMFYVHPWEVDPDQPRIDCGRLTRIRHYRGLERTMPRLERLLAEFRFALGGAA